MFPSILRSSIVATGVFALAGFAHAETAKAVAGEWGTFRGPNHDGTAPAPKGVTDWTKAKFQQLWKHETPSGFSSFSVAGGKVYTIVTREVEGSNSEVLVCLDIKDGKEIWAKPLTIMAKYDGGGDSGTNDNKGGDGPRSTPAINDGKVYAIDANLGVFCFDAANGKEVWNHSVLKSNNGVTLKWHNAASPVIDGDILLMCGGGSGQAILGFDKKTGAIKWKGQDDKMTHATPIIADILGIHQAIFFTQKGLVGITPSTGKVIWRADFPYKVSTAASPVVWEDIVYCSAGYGVGAGAFKMTKDGSGLKATQIWRTEGDTLANHWSTPVVKDGYLYGMFSFKKYGEGPVACVDIRTGAIKWSQAGFGPGQVILADKTVIAISDKGEVVAIAANPESYTELKREKVVDGKVWSYPVLAYDHLFARSTKEGGCWELK